MPRPKRRPLAPIATFAALLLTSSPHALRAAEEKLVDGVAAIVNGKVITLSQIREMIAARERALRDATPKSELADRVRDARLSALKDLIDRELIVQEFKKQNLQMPEYVLDDRINTLIREEFGNDRAAFLRTLQAQGYTLGRFREIEREKIIVQAMRQKYVPDKVTVSPAKVDEFYRKNIDQFREPARVKLRMISMRKGANAEEAAANLKAANEIRAKIVGGADFSRMAQMYSEDSMHDSGGDWGWIDPSTLNENLSEIAFKLKPGEVSEVLTLGENYYVLLVEAKKNSIVHPLGEVRQDIERKLVQDQRQQALQKWIDGLRDKAFIKTF